MPGLLRSGSGFGQPGGGRRRAGRRAAALLAAAVALGACTQPPTLGFTPPAPLVTGSRPVLTAAERQAVQAELGALAAANVAAGDRQAATPAEVDRQIAVTQADVERLRADVAVLLAEIAAERQACIDAGGVDC